MATGKFKADPLKYRRVKKLCPLGVYHRTFEAIWATIPETLKKELSSRQLLEVCNVSITAHNNGAHHAKVDAVNEGRLYVAGGSHPLGPKEPYLS